MQNWCGNDKNKLAGVRLEVMLRAGDRSRPQRPFPGPSGPRTAEARPRGRASGAGTSRGPAAQRRESPPGALKSRKRGQRGRPGRGPHGALTARSEGLDPAGRNRTRDGAGGDPAFTQQHRRLTPCSARGGPQAGWQAAARVEVQRGGMPSGGRAGCSEAAASGPLWGRRSAFLRRWR